MSDSQAGSAAIHLGFGDQAAVVAPRGATLVSYAVAGRDAVVPFPPDEAPPAYNGDVLAPWPNRLRDGTYVWDGVIQRLPLNDGDRHNALHGLVFDECWHVASVSTGGVWLALDLPRRDGWGFDLRLETGYELSDEGLTVEVRATNRGTAPLPYGVGFHPWLSAGGASLDDCTVQVDADTHVLADERLLPAGTEPVAGPYDLRRPAPLAGLDLDDAWVDAAFDQDGRSWGRLGCPDGRTVAVWMEAPLTCWQVCSGDHVAGFTRAGLAVEPMTCVADAFNTGERLVVLAPGETHAVRWGIQVR